MADKASRKQFTDCKNEVDPEKPLADPPTTRTPTHALGPISPLGYLSHVPLCLLRLTSHLTILLEKLFTKSPFHNPPPPLGVLPDVLHVSLSDRDYLCAVAVQGLAHAKQPSQGRVQTSQEWTDKTNQSYS